MSEEKLLTVREVSLMLGITEKEVMDLAESGALPAYKIGGVYLRFKKDQILGFLKSSQQVSSSRAAESKYPLSDRLSDFFYFNDFYLIAVGVIVFLLVIIFKGQ
jgi:excisionase family DNA binding protein